MVNTLKCYDAILFNDGKWWAFGPSKFYMHTKWIICIICFSSLFSSSVHFLWLGDFCLAVFDCYQRKYEQMSISSQLKDNVIVSVGKWCLWHNDVELCISVKQLCSCSCSKYIKYVIIFFMSPSITTILPWAHTNNQNITRSRQCALFPIAENTL